MKEADWPILKVRLPKVEWCGLLAEPLCLADDLDQSFEARVEALETQLGIRVQAPGSPAFWAFVFRSIPGFWPPGWDFKGPIKAKRPRGRKPTYPVEMADDLAKLRRQGFEKEEALFQALQARPEYRAKSVGSIKAAYHRAKKLTEHSPSNLLSDAYRVEDESGEVPYGVPDDDLTRTCLQHWSDWSGVLVSAWPAQKEVLTKHRSFWHRPVVLSRYMYLSRLARAKHRSEPE